MAANDSAFSIAALVRATEQSQHKPQGDSHQAGGPFRGNPTIAISREVGANGTNVAREVGRLLSWTVYDHELLEAIAKELNVGIHQVEYADERPGNWLEESFETFGSARAVTEVSYFVHLRAMLWSLAERGQCVIVGRGAAFILPMATTLRVRIQAPLAERIETISRDKNCSKSEAMKFIEKETARRGRFIENHFRKNPEEAQHYDLVLDTSRFSVNGCAEMIVEGLRRLPHFNASHASEIDQQNRELLDPMVTPA